MCRRKSACYVSEITRYGIILELKRPSQLINNNGFCLQFKILIIPSNNMFRQCKNGLYTLCRNTKYPLIGPLLI